MKIQFLNKCALEENTDFDCDKFPWILRDSLQVVLGETPLIIPAGFKTDLASVPSILHWFQTPYGREMNKPSVLHDFLYSAELLPRGKMDDIFGDALKACGMPDWKANICWSAVRACGGFTYGEHTPERIAKIRRMAHILDECKRPLWKAANEIKQTI